MAQSQKVSFNPGYKKPSFFKLVAQNKTLLLMCLPAVVFFFIFSYMPMPGAYIAFTNFQYNKGIWASPFVGLQNFKFLFTSGQLTLLLRNTILYNVAFIVLGNFLQLLFAILLNEVQSKRYKKTTQSMMFLPYFISDVLVSLLVYNLLNYDYGFISNLVRSMGGEMAKVYQMPNAWPFIIVLVNLIINASANAGLSAVIKNALASVSFALAYLSITTPLIYQFGLEKARYIMIVCAFVPFLLSYIFSLLAEKGCIVLPAKETIAAVSVYTLPILTALFFIGSYMISKLIFLKKDL